METAPGPTRASPSCSGTISIPVCGRRFLKQHSATSVEALAKAPLLNLDRSIPAGRPGRSGSGWSAILSISFAGPDWQQLHQYPECRHRQSGRGNRLVWPDRTLVKDGSLVRFGKAKVLSPLAFYVTWNDHRKLDNAAEQLKTWLIYAGAATLNSVSAKALRLEMKVKAHLRIAGIARLTLRLFNHLLFRNPSRWQAYERDQRNEPRPCAAARRNRAWPTKLFLH